MNTVIFGTLVLPDQLLTGGAIGVLNGRIANVGPRDQVYLNPETTVIEHDGYIAPGYVDLHVHGGMGSDFMDGDRAAFETAIAAHLRHGTTSIVPTTTVAPHEMLLAMLTTCRELVHAGPCPARVLGAHFYGPYFGKQAAGCHPAGALRDPDPKEFARYLEFADIMVSATVAPELPGAEAFAHACRQRGIVLNIGHSHATFDQVRAAVGWGARHVDHLFCAMSDRARLRQTQTYPMRGGVLEATLFFDELTTEVIADGKHLAAELLLLAHKIKGPDKLALVTDCSRALDLPDGEYLFGPRVGGEPFVRKDDVGVMPDGQALASSVMGMDHMVRTYQRLTGCPIPQAIKMATLTPARIIRKDYLVGSLAVGKLADILLLDKDLNVQEVWVGGERAHPQTAGM